MKFRVIDLETTDRAEAKESGERVGVVEIGYTDVTDQLEIGDTYAAFVNPGFPIPPQGRAVHHISDKDVAGAMNYMQACQTLMKGMETGDIFVAHNAPFEQTFFGGGQFPWICTMRCSQHVFQDAPNYGNQFLRYWLGVDEEIAEPARAMPPHRAGPDTYVTSSLLDQSGRAKFQIMLIGTTDGITKEESGAIARRLAELINQHGLEVPKR